MELWQTFLAEPPTIETDLTAEEHALIEEGMKDYENDPSSFVPLDSIK